MVEYSNKNFKKLKEDIYTAMKDSGGNEPGMVCASILELRS